VQPANSPSPSPSPSAEGDAAEEAPASSAADAAAAAVEATTNVMERGKAAIAAATVIHRSVAEWERHQEERRVVRPADWHKKAAKKDSKAAILSLFFHLETKGKDIRCSLAEYGEQPADSRCRARAAAAVATRSLTAFLSRCLPLSQRSRLFPGAATAAAN